MVTCLSSRFKSIILWPGMTYLVPRLSQNAPCVWGVWCHSLSFETFLSFINRLLGPITSWEIDEEIVEAVSNFIFGGSKITADGDCSHEIKRHLLLGRKVMTNLDNILKSRDKGPSSQVMVFPVIMYGCESWTVKKAEHQKIDAFKLWCWRRLWESLGLQGGNQTSPF